MNEPEKDHYSFNVEWIDSETGFVRKFLLHFFPGDNTLELFDLNVNRIFLKRCLVRDVRPSDFYINNNVTILGRLMTIVDYADLHTKNKLCKKSQRTLALIKPSGMPNIGGIFRHLHECGFTILKCRMLHIRKEHAESLYELKNEESHYPLLIEHIIREPILAILLMGENAICALKEAMGPSDPQEACKRAPTSLRALYGESMIANAIHGSADDAEFAKNMAMFFPEKFTPDLKSCFLFKNPTLCIIKPHAIREGLHGAIIHAIMECKFNITGMQMFHLDATNAAEFLEVYKGVVPDYAKMVTQLSSGACIAMEITTSDFNEETPQQFRSFVGPSDPDLARQVRPNTLRARFGRTKIENAIHCTDLPEDGLLEVEYFFKILQF